MNNVLISPIITEKSTQLIQKGWYTFAIHLESNKTEVAKAVEDQFKVHVVDVRTTLVKGKTKRVGKRRALTSQSNWKKAMVRLKPTEKIELFQVDSSPK